MGAHARSRARTRSLVAGSLVALVVAGLAPPGAGAATAGPATGKSAADAAGGWRTVVGEQDTDESASVVAAHAGLTYVAARTDAGVLLAQLDADGVVQWTRSLESAGEQVPRDIAAGDWGVTVLSADVDDQAESPDEADDEGFALTRLGTGGGTTWARAYPVPGRVDAVAVSGESTYVVGSDYEGDAVVRRYATDTGGLVTQRSFAREENYGSTTSIAVLRDDVVVLDAAWGADRGEDGIALRRLDGTSLGTDWSSVLSVDDPSSEGVERFNGFLEGQVRVLEGQIYLTVPTVELTYQGPYATQAVVLAAVASDGDLQWRRLLARDLDEVSGSLVATPRGPAIVITRKTPFDDFQSLDIWSFEPNGRERSRTQVGEPPVVADGGGAAWDPVLGLRVTGEIAARGEAERDVFVQQIDPQETRVSVATSPRRVRIRPGQRREVPLLVSNTGNVPTTYTVTSRTCGPRSGVRLLGRKTRRVGPTEPGRFYELTLRLGAARKAGAGQRTCRLAIGSLDRPGFGARAELVVTLVRR